MSIVATTGFFDGVHAGHRSVLKRVVDIAREQGKESAVVTFWPHPRIILHHDSHKLRLLNSLDEKKEFLYAVGIDRVIVLPFTPEFARISPKHFFEEYLYSQIHVDTLIVGDDHHLGNNAGAGYEQLCHIGEQLHVAVEQVALLKDEGIKVSSTNIRELLLQGEVVAASDLLGYYYRLQGVVVEGQRLGRQLGFPTANMQLYEPLKQLPANGVYVTRIALGNAFFYGMTNIGIRPTVQNDCISRTIETNIFDFADDIYGQSIIIEFIARLRSEQCFNSLTELKRQLEKDRDAAKFFLAQSCNIFCTKYNKGCI